MMVDKCTPRRLIRKPVEISARHADMLACMHVIGQLTTLFENTRLRMYAHWNGKVTQIRG